jgi:hypothetical protein
MVRQPPSRLTEPAVAAALLKLFDTLAVALLFLALG